jgi:CubicO group peptidase (beta-lactamase class C family)
MRNRIAGLLAVLLLVPTPSTAQDRALEALVDSIAADHIDGGRLAGISVGVTRGDEVLLKKAYGHADLEWDVPMPMDAVHEIGSVTKQFTSVALLQLWEQGKVDLDADMTEYLPDYDTQGRKIPLRRLFDHTSGIKGYTEMAEFGQLMTRRMERDSLVAIFEAVPLEFEPGYALIYNNSAFFLLGLVIENVSGQSYEDYIEEHVFAPAGMERSSYCSNSEVVEKRAHGYQGSPDGLIRADYIDHTWPFAAGSLCSTVSDLLTWNRALHEGDVLSDEAYEILITPRPLEDGTPTRYAMGIANHRIPSGHVIEHGGGIPGFVSHSRYYPEHDVAVVVLQNSTTPPGPGSVANAIGEHLFGTEDVFTARPYDEDLSVFEGLYRGPARGQTLTARVAVDDEGRLTLGAGPGEPQPVEHRDGTTFFRNTTLMTFDMSGGEITGLKLRQGGGIYVLEPVDEEAEAAARPEVPIEVMERYAGRYEVGPSFILEVRIEDGQMVTQATGQNTLEVFPTSETVFEQPMIGASLEFIEEGGEIVALILRQGGQEIRAPKLDG